MKPAWQFWKPLLPLLAAAGVAFGGCLAGSFHFDDYALLSDRAITSHAGWWEVWRPVQTRPLTFFTFWLSYRCGGEAPAGYHAVNLALHLLAVALLYSALSQLISKRAAFIAAAIFAIHPIQAEGVNYIFARGTLLATVLCLASLNLWVRERFWMAAACFGGALLAQEECAAFPVFLLLLHLGLKRTRGELIPLGSMFAFSSAAGARLLWVTSVTSGSAAGFASGSTPWKYLAAQGSVILRYLRLLFLPWGFTVDPGIGSAGVWIPVLAWAAILCLAILGGRRFWQARAGIWFLAGLILLSPTSSVVPLADLAADRRMYLPLIAFCACLGLMLERVDARVLVALAMPLIGISVIQTQVWRTEESLWTQAVQRAPDKVRPKIQLARAVAPPRSLALLDEAQKLAPDDPAIPAEKGRIYLVSGHPAAALRAFGRALALAPGDPRALNNRGVALLALGQPSAARDDFERALAINACLFDARLNLKRVGIDAPPSSACRFNDQEAAALDEAQGAARR